MQSNLRSIVKSRFANNPALCYLPTSSECFTDAGVDFELRLLSSLAKKPTGIKVEDPFSPPFEEGIFISELTKTHSLVFNKFCVCDEHVVVFPNAFERQDTPLTLADFEAAVCVVKSLTAFMFFNCGPLSGSSVLHKHMQFIPFSSTSSDLLPVEKAIL